MIPTTTVFLALLLIPTFLCLVVLKSVFPKNALKIPDVHLIPVGLGLTFLVNIINGRLFALLEYITPPVCVGSVEGLQNQFIENLIFNQGKIVNTYLEFLGYPVGLFTLFLIAIRWFWRMHIMYKHEQDSELPSNATMCVPWLRRRWIDFVNVVGSKTEDILVHYMGRLASVFPRKYMVMADVLDSQDSLYSGIFMEYLLEDGKLVGIRLSNVLRYSFKSEKDRKEQKLTEGLESNNSPYLLPNEGTMFFPIEKIQNFHFWRVSKGDVNRIQLSNRFNQVKFIWLLGVSYSLPHLELRVIGTVSEDDKDTEYTELLSSFEKLRIPNQYLTESLEFVSKKS